MELWLTCRQGCQAQDSQHEEDMERKSLHVAVVGSRMGMQRRTAGGISCSKCLLHPPERHSRCSSFQDGGALRRGFNCYSAPPHPSRGDDRRQREEQDGAGNGECHLLGCWNSPAALASHSRQLQPPCRSVQAGTSSSLPLPPPLTAMRLWGSLACRPQACEALPTSSPLCPGALESRYSP